ncbi:hypothetical protein T11_5988 [Trichinella zimbabwensis]|uniref:Uncharacterized protein n=1 Tax=Trichinella zimbabwensis TaxID=268475 RepID=A0A0V1GDQ1_9BILA|nr:hypothetical protein T11_5988 [Trichinella zimbabwensis]
MQWTTEDWAASQCYPSISCTRFSSSLYVISRDTQIRHVVYPSPLDVT